MSQRGSLKHRKQEVIIRTFPTFSPNPLGRNYGNYCEYAQIKYKPWSGQVNPVWDGLDSCHENHIHAVIMGMTMTMKTVMMTMTI